MAVSIQGNSSQSTKAPHADYNNCFTQGIYHFVTHPYLYPLLRARLLPCFALSAVVMTILFVFTYLPQVALLAIFQGGLAWFNAAVLVLGEGAAITALLFEAFLVDETLVDIFDAVRSLSLSLAYLSTYIVMCLQQVLIDRGFINLVSSAREIHRDNTSPLKQLGPPPSSSSTQYSPFSLRQILEFILLLPLNLIPIAGTPAFLILTGRRAGPFHHWRYFQLRGFSKKDRRLYIRRRRVPYTWFVFYNILSTDLCIAE